MARIAFVGPLSYWAGQTQAVLGYIRAGQRLGHDVRVSEWSVLLDSEVSQRLPIAPRDWRPDLLVLLFDSWQYLSDETMQHIERASPRAARVVVDADGKSSPAIHFGGDTNLSATDASSGWSMVFNRLSERILQPRISQGDSRSRFLFWGVDTYAPRPRPGLLSPLRRRLGKKPYDLVYVGNNWYRWADMDWLIRGLIPVRPRLGRLAIFGRWWLGEGHQEFPDAAHSDPELLSAQRVEVHPNVPLGTVEQAIGQGRMSPIMVRPALSALGLVTPRAFETFAADAVPLLAPSAAYALGLYGPEARHLLLPREPAAKVLEVLDRYREYRELARDVAARLAREHSYEVRLRELLAFCP